MVNFNGKLLPTDSLLFGYKNRGLRHGDALSESLRVVHGKLVFWEDHYLKLMAAMRILRMEIPMNFTLEYLESQILMTSSENDLNEQGVLVDLLIFRNSGGAIYPENGNVCFLIETNIMNTSEYPLHDGSYEIELFKDFYTSGDMLSTLNTNNKMLNIVGSIFTAENDYGDCLLLNHAKMVVGSLAGNVFLVKGTTIKTAPLSDGCLNTVIRDRIIKIIRDSEVFEFEENSISPFELQKADELFIVNIENGVIPVTKYRKKEYTSLTSEIIRNKINELVLSDIESN